MSKKLGQLVREARTELGLSQEALARKVEGLSASDIGKIERGEKEPTQAVIRLLAKALGVTQRSLLDAASGTAARKTSAADKTSSAGKTSTARKTTSKKTDDLTLTATEKKLVQAYRKADAGAKKAALNLLSGNGNILEILPVLMSGGGSSSGSSSGSGGATQELLSTLLSGKTGSSSGNGELLNTLVNSLIKK